MLHVSMCIHVCLFAFMHTHDGQHISTSSAPVSALAYAASEARGAIGNSGQLVGLLCWSRYTVAQLRKRRQDHKHAHMLTHKFTHTKAHTHTHTHKNLYAHGQADTSTYTNPQIDCALNGAKVCLQLEGLLGGHAEHITHIPNTLTMR